MKELSTKWWNVIRRQMTSVAATEDTSAQCPDCGTPMHLMQGKFGRFYKCKRYGCLGTLGARLDGTPRVQKGPPELLEARRRARDAIHEVVLEIDYQASRRPDQFICIDNEGISVAEVELAGIVGLANLTTVQLPRWRAGRLRGWEGADGLYLRRRSVEECERIVAAACDYLRMIRRNAWDQILIEVIDRERKTPEPSDPWGTRTAPCRS